MKNRGVTLIEVTVAMGVMGLVALGAAALISWMGQSSNQNQEHYSAMMFQQDANYRLRDPDLCPASIRMLDALPSPGAVNATTTARASVDATGGGTFFTAGDKAADYPQMGIAKIEISGITYRGISAANNPVYTGTVVFQPRGMNSAAADKPRTLVTFEFEYVEATRTVIHCGLDIGFAPIINLEISADTLNYNIFSEAGSPSQPVIVILTVDQGVWVGSTDTSTPALITGGPWPNGSKITILNKGTLSGAGGAGRSAWGGGGGSGGPALFLGANVEIQNLGTIQGGGGGGGGGNDWSYWCWGIHAGGGGGGAGEPPGQADPDVGWSDHGENGTRQAGGAGRLENNGCGGNGGNGGGPGQGGSPGTGLLGSGGSSGGSAIVTNGYRVTFSPSGSAGNILGTTL